MKKYFVLATLFLMSTYAHAANVTWYGSAGWRYSAATQKDGTSNTVTVPAPNALSGSISERTEKAHKFRGELGATGGWDNVEWGIGARTYDGGGSIVMPTQGNVVNSDWTTTNSDDFNVRFNRAWFRYGNDWGFGDIGLTFGRQAPGFMMGSTQVFIDNDVNFDGVAETWKWGSFGLNLGQYILGARNQGTQGSSRFVANDPSAKNASTPGGFSVLYSFQPNFTWKFTDEITGMFAVGYHMWSNTTGTNFRNVIPNGGTNGVANSGFVTGNQTTVSGATSALANSQAFAREVYMENSRQWQFVTKFTLPYMLAFDFEYIMNKDQFYANATTLTGAGVSPNVTTQKLDKSAWAASLSYGQLKKAHDFMIGYAYHDKGLGSVHSRFSYDRVLAGFTAHEVSLGYNIANGMTVAGRALFENEKSPRDYQGKSVTSKISTTYYEVSTGVRF